MARGRRRDEWERTAALMVWIAGTFTGQRFDVEQINPIPKLQPEQTRVDPEIEKAEAWDNLREGFRQWVKR